MKKQHLSAKKEVEEEWNRIGEVLVLLENGLRVFEGNIDMAFFAKHFMKNREETIEIHINLLSNR